MADDYRPGQSDIEPVRCEGKARIIDFRSPFTAMHSAGVAASARELARLADLTLSLTDLNRFFTGENAF